MFDILWKNSRYALESFNFVYLLILCHMLNSFSVLVKRVVRTQDFLSFLFVSSLAPLTLSRTLFKLASLYYFLLLSNILCEAVSFLV